MFCTSHCATSSQAQLGILHEDHKFLVTKANHPILIHSQSALQTLNHMPQNSVSCDMAMLVIGPLEMVNICRYYAIWANIRLIAFQSIGRRIL